jgi:nucleotide-binding universal stress UspA family protein
MRILMATGGSPHSELALRFGAFLASRARTAPTVVTVIKKPSDRARGERILEAARKVLEPEVPAPETRTRLGHPAEEIVREAEEGDYDLVILGEKQHHGLVTRFLLGSTAVRVVEHAPCPVVIAKGAVRPLNRILVCDSGAPSSSLLARFATQLGPLIRPDDEVTVMHVMSQIEAGLGVESEPLDADADDLISLHAPEGELLERDMHVLEGLSAAVRPLVRHGLVVDEILSEAREGDYDLVVIGAHVGSGWRRILLDDIAHEIVVRVDRPILVVR